jgi:hypothetical protein
VTYLNDHFAGSTAALQLLDHLIKTGGIAGDQEFFTALRAEIAEDQAVLEGLIRRLDDGPSPLRHVGGWFAEKIGRLKLMLDDPAGDALKELESLEVLVLGIHGKRALWRGLREMSASVPELSSVDLNRLEARADDQHARVEDLRLATARRVLGPTGNRP